MKMFLLQVNWLGFFTPWFMADQRFITSKKLLSGCA